MDEGKRRPNEIKLGATLSFAVIGLQFIVTMVYTPIMLRLLGQTEYGLYALVLSIVGYLSLISFGFGGAYMRFYARFHVLEDWDGVRRLNGMFLLVFTAMGLVAAACGTLLAINVGAVLGDQFSADELGTARLLFMVLAVNLGITFPSSLFNSYVIAHERFIFQKSLQILKAVAAPLATVPVLWLGYRSVGMVIATTSVNIAFSAYTVVYSYSKLKMRFSFRHFDFPLFREVTVFSSYLFINMIVDQVNWNVDKFILGRFYGAIPVAIYGVAALLNTSYITFSTAVSGVLIPRVNMMVSSGKHDRQISDLFIRVGRIQFLVLGLVISGFVFFGRSFIEIWAGRTYGQAYHIALLLLVPVTLPLIQNLGIEIQKAMNLHQFRSWLYLAGALMHIAIGVPLTHRFGGVGAATATAATLILFNGIIMNWYYQTRVGLDIISFWRQIIRLSMGMIPALIAGVTIAANVDLGEVAPLLTWGIGYCIVYAGGMFLLGMNKDERRLFVAPAQRILKKRRGAE